MIIKSALSEVSVWFYWTFNRICGFNINAQNGQGCTGIGPALVYAAEELKRNAVTIWLQRHYSNRNKGNIKKDDLTTLPLAGNSWMSCKNSSIDCISTKTNNISKFYIQYWQIRNKTERRSKDITTSRKFMNEL